MNTSKNLPIMVWPFQAAPQDLKDLSDNGGDEDWLVLVPPGLVEEFLRYGVPSWVDAMGACGVDEHTLVDGSKVFIASHA
jgi:hypothetical protein